MPQPHDILLVLVTVPDRESGERLALALVENRLAACVNLLSPCHSVYRWQGKVERAEEVPMFIKTGKDKYPALEAFILANHPYEVPEIVAVPLGQGLSPYLDWVETMTLEEKENEGDPEDGKGMTCV